MVALIILGILLLLIIIICLVPVGADISFIDDKLKVYLKVDGFLIKVFPKKKKEDNKESASQKEKPKNTVKKPKENNKKKKEIKLYFRKDEIINLLKRITYKFKRFNNSFRADKFLFHYVAGGRDPYRVALKFAYVNAFISAVLPVSDSHLKCKNLDVKTDVDFTADWSLIDLDCAIVIRIGAFPILAFGIINSTLWILIKNKVRLLWEKLFDKEQYVEDTTSGNYLKDFIEKIKSLKEGAKVISKEDKIIKETIDEFESYQAGIDTFYDLTKDIKIEDIERKK